MNCSFCGTSQADANQLIAGPGVAICDACVRLCLEIIEPPPIEPEEQLRAFLVAAMRRLDVEGTIEVKETPEGIRVDVHTTRPGLMIGRRGVTASRLRAGLAELTDGPVRLNIVSVPDPG